jgi:hypothetical protein
MAFAEWYRAGKRLYCQDASQDVSGTQQEAGATLPMKNKVSLAPLGPDFPPLYAMATDPVSTVSLLYFLQSIKLQVYIRGIQATNWPIL